MNGVHDMGGMQGFGPVVPEADEPRFHAPWERRAFALTLAMGATGPWNLDQSRAARESLPPAQYLASSYYQIWLAALGAPPARARTRHAGRDRRRADARAPPRSRRRPRRRTRRHRARGGQPHGADARRRRRASRSATRSARAIMHPSSHTRLPRYCRGKSGIVASAPRSARVPRRQRARRRASNRSGCIRCASTRASSGAPTPRPAAVHVDCWEPYLEAR